MMGYKQLTSLVEEYAKTFAALPLEVQESIICQCQEDVLVLAGGLVPKAIGAKMKLAFWCYIFRKL